MTHPDRREESRVPEPREHSLDAPGMLEYFEQLGDEMDERYKRNVPLDTRFRHRNPTLKDSFTLVTGDNAEIRFLPGPKLFRNTRSQATDLPRMWLPSGGLSVTRTEEDGTEVLKSYSFGRSLASNTHQTDSTVLRRITWERKPGETQEAVSHEAIYTNTVAN